MKQTRYLCIIVCVALGLTTACTEEENTTTVSSDTTLSMFYLSHDSVSAIKNTKFIIDNDSNLIYNTAVVACQRADNDTEKSADKNRTYYSC